MGERLVELKGLSGQWEFRAGGIKILPLTLSDKVDIIIDESAGVVVFSATEPDTFSTSTSTRVQDCREEEEKRSVPLISTNLSTVPGDKGLIDRVRGTGEGEGRRGALSHATTLDTDSDSLCEQGPGGISFSYTESEKSEIKKTYDTLTSPKIHGNGNGKKSKITPCKNKKALLHMLQCVDVSKFRAEYSMIDVDEVWKVFCDVVVNGTQAAPEPNPYNYTRFSAAFRNWCKNEKKSLTKPQRRSILDRIWDEEGEGDE